LDEAITKSNLAFLDCPPQGNQPMNLNMCKSQGIGWKGLLLILGGYSNLVNDY